MMHRRKVVKENTGQGRNPLLSAAERREFRKYEYPLENLAFEGGGSKGLAYVGVIRVLEEIGVWEGMKRFAGTSAGSIGALVAALGYNSYEIEQIMSINLAKMYFDAALGVAGIPMMKVRYGLHPGRKFLKWLGDIVADKLGNPDATFADLYHQTGRELCVVAVNVNQLDCEYLHVKTTPDMPIRIAVRMSSAIPGMVAPVKYTLHGTEQLFCDGGLVVNYPIHAFDSWYLSMDLEDAFLRRIPNLHNIVTTTDTSFKFGTEADANKKTVGILLYSEAEQEIFKAQLDERLEKYIFEPNPIPNTKRARTRQKALEKKTEASAEHDQLFEAMSAFVDLLRGSDVNSDGAISREELKNALATAGPEFDKEQRVRLFGSDVTSDELFDSIDQNKDGQITLSELVSFAEQRGIQLRKMCKGFEGRIINNVGGYFDAIVETLLLNMKKITMRSTDLHRTIGVNTKYLDTLDFDMEHDDKDFLLKQGKDGCIAFLRYHNDVEELRERKDNGEQDEELNGKYVPPKYFSLKKRQMTITSRFVGFLRSRRGADGRRDSIAEDKPE